ncbi:hypothetical protein Clacol_000647 [Clathrus columnatus]|uniref:Plasma membrane fusion protein PRM1 n=1 Tax=Clathrus columnatus TaxID=1419009 RepID=A0AAV5A0B3_9AGAM|nr:hypothetical protein Clacol_000647 [Clathrus columnatus]
MSTQRIPTPPPTYDQPNVPQTALKPYLTLPYLLSLSWLAYPILSLLFVAFRLQLSLASAQDAISNAKDDLLTSCNAAQHAATVAASLPRFMAVSTNKQIVDAVNSSLNGAREALILSLTVMEAIINFIVDTYRSTFLCFLELVVQGGLAILIGAVNELQSFIQSTFSGIRTNIQSDVAAANSAISTAINGINKILPFGASINVPQFSIPSLNALNNVTLPTDFETALLKLNSSLPSLSDLRSSIDNLIDTPFELVKKEINETFFGLTFNESLLAVPQSDTISFCGQLNTGVIDDLGQELIKVAKIGVILLIVLALLLVAGNCLLEWYKWRSLHRHLERTRRAWTSDPTVYHLNVNSSTPVLQMTDHNLLCLHATSMHPLLARIANRLATIFRLSPTQYTHLQFFFHYVFHPPALACFLIGFFGLLSVELQLLALGPVQAKFSDQVASTVADFSSAIAASMNASMKNQSTAYANEINGHILTVQSSINDGLFGWVNTTTTTLNTTIVTFYSDIQSAVTTVFGGTILDQPMQAFVRCLLGTKVTAIEDALTFLHNNLQVNFPVVNQSILVLSPEEVNEAAQPISEAAVGGGSGNSEGLVGRLVDTYVSSLRKERVMFAIFLGLWLFVVSIALLIIFWHSYGKNWMDSRKRMRWETEQRSRVIPFVHPQQSNRTEKLGSDLSKHQPVQNISDLPSFGPLNSPDRPGFFSLKKSAAAPTQVFRSLKPLSSDASSVDEDQDSTKFKEKFMGFKTLRRKTFGREIPTPDEEVATKRRTFVPSHKTEYFEVEVREERGRPWWQRLLKRRGSDDSFESGGEKTVLAQPLPALPLTVTSPKRLNPQLTIQTNIGIPISQRRKLPIVVQDEEVPLTAVVQDEAPMISQHSVPPRVAKPQLEQSRSETPSVSVPIILPLPSNFKPIVAVPESVQSSRVPVMNNLASRSAPGLNVPIHHGFVRPIPAETPSSPSPPSSPYNYTSLAPPVTRYHSRASSQTMPENPFATCFDDEYGIMEIPLRQTNPFSDSIGTPRAV